MIYYCQLIFIILSSIQLILLTINYILAKMVQFKNESIIIDEATHDSAVIQSE
jgi:hypothetical protein